jgi:hypothetical protein
MNPSVFSASYFVNLPNDVLEKLAHVVGETSRLLSKLLCNLHDSATHHLRIDAASPSAPTLNEVTIYLSKLPNLNSIELLNSTDYEMGSFLVERAGLTRLVVDNYGHGQFPASIHAHGPIAAETLASCVDLRCLALRNIKWPALENLMALSALSSLTHVSLSEMHNIVGFQPLAACSKLVSLTILDCDLLSNFAPLSAMTGLTSFTLACPCYPFDESPFEALANHPSLSVLKSIGLIGKVDLSPIATCSKLETLRLQYEGRERLDLGWIGQLTSLTSIDLRGFMRLTSLEALANNSSLRRLDVRNCPRLHALSFTCLEACNQLSTLLCDHQVVLRGGGLLAQTHPSPTLLHEMKSMFLTF